MLHRSFVPSILASALAITLLSAFVAVPAWAQRRPLPLPQKYMELFHSKDAFGVFDWDDNSLKLPSRNALFLKGDTTPLLERRFLMIDASEYSQFRHDFGAPGSPLERFEIVGDDIDPLNGSFRFSRPGRNGHNYMLEDMENALLKKGMLVSKMPDEYKAPFYELYIQRESNPATRPGTRILTARGQLPTEFHAALSFLAEIPEIAATGYRPTDMERIDLVGGKKERSFDLKAQKLVEYYGEAVRAGYRLFYFSDDDKMNVQRAVEVLAKLDHPIPVMVIWTRENGHSHVIELSRLQTRRKPGISVEELLKEAFTAEVGNGAEAAAHREKAKSALGCRALFF